MDVFTDPITFGVVVKLWVIPAVYVFLTLTRTVVTLGLVTPARSVLYWVL